MTTQTTIEGFIPAPEFIINKRTKRGRRALERIAESSAEYEATIGKSSDWDEDGLVYFSLKDAVGTASAVIAYLNKYQPKDLYRRESNKPFTLLLDGVWDVYSERWVWTNTTTYRFTDESQSVVATTKKKTYDTESYVLTPVLTVCGLVDEAEADRERVRVRDQRIADLKEAQPLPQSERYAVQNAQKFVDEFSHDIVTNSKWKSDNLLSVRGLAVRMVARDIAEAFLAVVGKTTLEVGTVVVNSWRDDDTVDHVIGVDEAFGKAVHAVLRNDHGIDSVTRDLFGKAVVYFTSEVLRGY